MKKKTVIAGILLMAIILGAVAAAAFTSSETYRKARAAITWDCSVSCAEESKPDKYVITYSDKKVISKTGTLTIQNRNDFDIIVHLLCNGEVEIVSNQIEPWKTCTIGELTGKEYTVGVHADVEENTDIEVYVYDGKDTLPYTK